MRKLQCEDKKLMDDKHSSSESKRQICCEVIFDFSRILWASLYPAKWRAKCSRRYVSDACNSSGCVRLCGKPIAAACLWKRHMNTHNRGIESNVWSLMRDFENGLCIQARVFLFFSLLLFVSLIRRIYLRYLTSYLCLLAVAIIGSREIVRRQLSRKSRQSRLRFRISRLHNSEEIW